MIENITSNPVFQLVGTISSMIGAIVGILAIIPKTRNIFFSYKQSVNVEEQRIEGTNNEQSGGNILNKDSSTIKNECKSKITVGRQVITGNGNKQAGGDINV